MDGVKEAVTFPPHDMAGDRERLMHASCLHVALNVLITLTDFARFPGHV